MVVLLADTCFRGRSAPCGRPHFDAHSGVRYDWGPSPGDAGGSPRGRARDWGAGTGGPGKAPILGNFFELVIIKWFLTLFFL